MAVHPLKSLIFLNLLLFIAPITADDNPTPVTGDPTEKCTPCTQNPPPSPPPPVYPPPPPPPPPDVIPYYSPPPPKKKEPKNNCPPPPSPSFIYITGPPGDLYPVDQNYSAASRRIVAAAIPAVIGWFLVGVLAI